MTIIPSGKLRSRIKLLDHNMNEIASVWADVRPITTREMLRNGALIANDTYTVQIRYRSGLNTAMLVEYKSVMYNIIGITDDYASDNIIITMEMDTSTNRIRSTS